MGTYLGKETNAKKKLTEKKKPKLVLIEIFICIDFSIPLLDYLCAWWIFQSFINFKCVSISFNIHFNTLLACHLFDCFLFLSFIIHFIFHMLISLCNLFESASWHTHNKKFQWLFLLLANLLDLPNHIAKSYCQIGHFGMNLSNLIIGVFFSFLFSSPYPDFKKNSLCCNTFTISAIDCRIINKVLNLNFGIWFFNSEIVGR